jgi:hypothetical protein
MAYRRKCMKCDALLIPGYVWVSLDVKYCHLKIMRLMNINVIAHTACVFTLF